MNDDEIKEVLSGMVMALCSTMPPDLAHRYGQALEVCARERTDAGRTSAGTLLRVLADSAAAAARIPRRPG